MKKIVLVLAIAFLGIACNSGKQKKDENRATKMVDKMTQICQLTPDQAGKIEPIIENFIKTNVDNRDKYANDQDALKRIDSTNRKNLMDTMQKILSPEQFEKLKAAKSQFKMNRQGGKGGGQDNGGQDQ